MSAVHLTKRELDIMSVLWELGEATVAEVRDRVDPDLAYTSVSTMVRMLETKGYVGHKPGEGKAHVYFPRIDATAAGQRNQPRERTPTILVEVCRAPPNLQKHFLENVFRLLAVIQYTHQQPEQD